MTTKSDSESVLSRKGQEEVSGKKSGQHPELKKQKAKTELRNFSVQSDSLPGSDKADSLTSGQSNDPSEDVDDVTTRKSSADDLGEVLLEGLLKDHLEVQEEDKQSPIKEIKEERHAMLATRSTVDNPSKSIETFEPEMVPNDLAIMETDTVVIIEHSPINNITYGEQPNEESIANESRIQAGSTTSTNEETQEVATKEAKKRARSSSRQDQSVGRNTQDFESKELQKSANDVGENIQEYAGENVKELNAEFIREEKVEYVPANDDDMNQGNPDENAVEILHEYLNCFVQIEELSDARPVAGKRQRSRRQTVLKDSEDPLDINFGRTPKPETRRSTRKRSFLELLGTKSKRSRSSYDIEGLNVESASGFVEVLGKLKCPQFSIYVKFLSTMRLTKYKS